MCKNRCYIDKSTPANAKVHATCVKVHATCAKVHLKMDKYTLRAQKYTCKWTSTCYILKSTRCKWTSTCYIRKSTCANEQVHLHMDKYMCKWRSTCANRQVHLSKQTIPQISILNDVASKIEIFNVLETKKDRQHVPIF